MCYSVLQAASKSTEYAGSQTACVPGAERVRNGGAGESCFCLEAGVWASGFWGGITSYGFLCFIDVSFFLKKLQSALGSSVCEGAFCLCSVQSTLYRRIDPNDPRCRKLCQQGSCWTFRLVRSYPRQPYRSQSSMIRSQSWRVISVRSSWSEYSYGRVHISRTASGYHRVIPQWIHIVDIGDIEITYESMQRVCTYFDMLSDHTWCTEYTE